MGKAVSSDLRSLLVDGLSLKPGECHDMVVVVTGAGQGVGLQVARSFAMLGSKVVIAEVAEAGRRAEEIILSEGGEAVYIQTDVSNPESVAHLQQMTTRRYGAVDVLVNNAIRIANELVIDLDVAEWDQIISVNLRGTFLTCKAFLPGMLLKRSGTIINMVSLEAMPGLSAYISSKQGIAGFSQSLALEVNDAGVRVVPFAPGMVDTPGIRSISSRLAERLGMAEKEFLSLSLHAGYDGLMPAEHAGAATAYLTLRLTDEYDGQIVDGYEVLERAGFLKAAALRTDLAEEDISAVRLGKNKPEATDLARGLLQILDETDAELSQLPFFVRPIARSGFKNKAGHSLPVWKRMAEQLIDELKSGGQATSLNYSISFENLIGYYRDVPSETARFTQDPEMLQLIKERCEERIATIRALKMALQNP